MPVLGLVGAECPEDQSICTKGAAEFTAAPRRWAREPGVHAGVGGMMGGDALRPTSSHGWLKKPCKKKNGSSLDHGGSRLLVGAPVELICLVRFGRLHAGKWGGLPKVSSKRAPI